MNKENRVDLLNIAAQLNIQGIYSFDDICSAQVGPNGTITAVCGKDRLPSAIICYKGSLRYDELENAGINGKIVLKDMRKQGSSNITDVYPGEFKDGCFRYISKDGIVYPEKGGRREHDRKKAPA